MININCDNSSGPAVMSVTEDGRSVLFGSTMKNIQEVNLLTLEKGWSASSMSCLYT